MNETIASQICVPCSQRILPALCFTPDISSKSCSKSAILHCEKDVTYKVEIRSTKTLVVCCVHLPHAHHLAFGRRTEPRVLECILLTRVRQRQSCLNGSEHISELTPGSRWNLNNNETRTNSPTAVASPAPREMRPEKCAKAEHAAEIWSPSQRNLLPRRV
jgi:hypothetical protein